MTLKRFIRNETGNIVLFTALALGVLVTVAGGAVDYSRYLRMKSSFNQAVDQALLASATSSQMQLDLNETASRYFAANFPNKGDVTLKNLTVTKLEGDTKWRIEATADLSTSVINMLGIKTLTLDHTAEVTWDTASRVEAVFLADTSSSMCMTVSRSTIEDGSFRIQYTPDRNCKKLNALKEALLYVIDHGFAPIANANGPLFTVGVVPFNHKVKLPRLNNIPTPLSRIETTHAKGSANYYTNFDDAEPLSAAIPLTAINTESDRATIRTAISNFSQKPEGLGWTRSNIATLAAGLMLDPAYNNAFGGVRPEDFGGDVEKVVVLMTDGANIGCCYASHPEGNYKNQYLYLYEVDNAHLTGLAKAPNMQRWATQYGIPEKGICDQLKERGVKIYSIVYDVNDSDPGGREIKDAYSYCASSSQYFFDVASDEDLKIAYKTVAQSFLKLRLSY